MNWRVFAVAVYIVIFFANLLVVANFPSTLFVEVAPILLAGVIMSLLGVLLSLWVYQDAQHIKRLNWRVEYLERKIREYEKKE